MIYTIFLFNIKNKIQCKISINDNPYLNLKWLVLCLKNIIAKYEPKDPPINDTDSRVFSGIRHFLLIAFILSINIKANERIFINNIYNKRKCIFCIFLALYWFVKFSFWPKWNPESFVYGLSDGRFYIFNLPIIWSMLVY